MNLVKYAVSAILTAVILLSANQPSMARAKYDSDAQSSRLFKTNAINVPCTQLAVHNINKLGLTITNGGQFGSGFANDMGIPLIDQVTGAPAASAIYPYPGTNKYLFAGSFWIGAVVGRDTLVSVGCEGWSYIIEMMPPPCGSPYNGEIERLSISNPEDILLGAKSEQDFIATYTDTVTDPSYVQSDPKDGRPHIPLNIEITQRSYAWSYDYAADFVLFDYEIKSLGRKDLNGVYMGFYVDGDVTPLSDEHEGAQDDICGFKAEIPYPFAPPECGIIDPIRIAWIADNDGRHSDEIQCPGGFELTGVTGMRVVRTPSDSLNYSFNWWISNGNAAKDFGPRMAGTPSDPFRDFGGYLGTPEGDRNKYYIMRHEEFDYDQLFTACDNTVNGWLPPSSDAGDFADGYDTRYLLSFGPFDIAPGEVLRVSFAYVAGEDFHSECQAFENLWNPGFPQEYYNQLNFDKFGRNASWAARIYDNPGRDTNGDSTFGEFAVCCYDTSYVYDTTEVEPGVYLIDTQLVCLDADTFWLTGDGVPDFEGARPPYPPKMWIYPSLDDYNRGVLRVRFNGFESETRRDDFSGDYDFEGYRIYQGITTIPSDFVMLVTYDREDYNRYEYNNTRNEWVLIETPFTLEELQEKYGPEFDPNVYNVDNLFYDAADTALYYFTPQDWNQADLTNPDLIHKIYPDEPPPTVLNADSALLYYPEELTDDGYFKYYEYEYTIKNLLPSQLYYISVTAFDYGSPISGLPSLETAKNQNMVAEYAQNTNAIVEEQRLNVIVYPNPYRNDAGYASATGGNFEGRDAVTGGSLNPERIRRVHFTNLPHKCTIRIFTLDGDLVREIDHDFPEGDPQSMHDTWDLITRNTQAAVSGIYYYSVESEQGSQIGKLVIIM
ncbi:MAG: hypothetical protein JW763_04745 [candidate division Zixibacteria bacterium]|nr:hypothetical protein [candidate division Zixibacteria bacterium]